MRGIPALAALTLPLLPLAAPPAAAQVEYIVRELPPIGAPIPISRAYDINDAGLAAGESWRDGQNFHAVVWQPDGTIIDLGEPGTESVARAISPAGGVIAGSFGGDAAMWIHGQLIELPGLPGAFGSSAWGVNDEAVAVGVSVPDIGPETAVLWLEGEPEPVLEAPSWASAIDNAGRIAGRRDMGREREAVLLDAGLEVTVLPDGASALASAVAIAGEWVAGDAGQEPVLWWLGASPAELVELEVTSAFGTVAHDVNSAGVAVGRMCLDLACDIDRQRAVIWRDGRLIDLNDLIDPASGWTLSDARGINTRGQIVGFGRLDTAGGVRAFVLTPLDICIADFDGDGELAFFDFLAFQNAFAAGEARADVNGDGVLDFFDFLEFQNLFAAGCA